MSATQARSLRIGEVAELTGTTPRTIRYYEEIGLLPGADDRAQGKHRTYSEADVERVREIIRMREEALGHITTQLELVRRRRHELEQLESELVAKRRLVQRRLAGMDE